LLLLPAACFGFRVLRRPLTKKEPASSSAVIGTGRTPRIGAAKGLSMEDCEAVVRAPVEERLEAFLDLLYSDGRRAGVTTPIYAQALFRRWLELSIHHDPETGAVFRPLFVALLHFYIRPRTLRTPDRQKAELSRRAAETAMRAPFEDLLRLYLRRVFDSSHHPGIRNPVHARETFVTFCQLLHAYQVKHGRD